MSMRCSPFVDDDDDTTLWPIAEIGRKCLCWGCGYRSSQNPAACRRGDRFAARSRRRACAGSPRRGGRPSVVETCSRSAISAFRKPSARSAITSTSRAVRPAGIGASRPPRAARDPMAPALAQAASDDSGRRARADPDEELVRAAKRGFVAASRQCEAGVVRALEREPALRGRLVLAGELERERLRQRARSPRREGRGAASRLRARLRSSGRRARPPAASPPRVRPAPDRPRGMQPRRRRGSAARSFCGVSCGGQRPRLLERRPDVRVAAPRTEAREGEQRPDPAQPRIGMRERRRCVGGGVVPAAARE